MLSWSIRLFRIRGIQLSVHFTFLLLLAYVAWLGWSGETEARWLGVAYLVSYVLTVFVCIVLHELGHAFTAQRYGIRVPRILLLPIGGMAQLEKIPREPRKEIAIALAGPAVNFVLIGILIWFVPLPNEWGLSALSQYIDEGGLTLQFLKMLVLMNLLMGTMNLLPIFPMDGGRIFRALLARRMNYLNATFYAATLGKILAFVAICLALFWSKPPMYMLSVLFGFIFFAGEAEYRIVRRQERSTAQWDRFLSRIARDPEPEHPTRPVA